MPRRWWLRLAIPCIRVGPRLCAQQHVPWVGLGLKNWTSQRLRGTNKLYLLHCPKSTCRWEAFALKPESEVTKIAQGNRCDDLNTACLGVSGGRMMHVFIIGDSLGGKWPLVRNFRNSPVRLSFNHQPIDFALEIYQRFTRRNVGNCFVALALSAFLGTESARHHQWFLTGVTDFQINTIWCIWKDIQDLLNEYHQEILLLN